MQQPLNPYFPPPPTAALAYAPYTDARDADHLRLLSIFHYVYGGITALFSCVFIIHIVLGVLMLRETGPFAPPPPVTTTPGGRTTTTAIPQPQRPPRELGWLFVGAGSTIILLGWTTAALTIASGRCIARRRARTFSMVVAGVNCLAVPLGTTLGVFTFIVLFRDSVAARYAQDGRRQIPDDVGRPPTGYN